eukprot:6729936-Pyramimonas_sp.AAC.1
MGVSGASLLHVEGGSGQGMTATTEASSVLYHRLVDARGVMVARQDRCRVIRKSDSCGHRSGTLALYK